MPYSKNNWNTGDTITKEKLNNLETQYDEVKAELEKVDGSSAVQLHGSNIAVGSVGSDQVDTSIALASDLGLVRDDLQRVAYDLYALWLEQYYLGEVAGGPDPSGAQAITFDGFLDASNLASYNGILDTTNQRILCQDQESLIPKSEYSLSYSTQGDAPNYPISNMKDGSTGTYFDLPGLDDDWTTTDDGYVYVNLPQAYRISKVTLWYGAGANGEISFRIYDIGTDSYYFTSGVENAGPYQGDYIPAEPILDSSFTLHASEKIGAASPAYFYELSIYAKEAVESVFTGATKNLEFNATRAKVYASDYRPGSSSVTYEVSLDGGVTWVSPTELSSRVDPKFPTYTERELEFEDTTGGSAFILRMTLTPAMVLCCMRHREGGCACVNDGTLNNRTLSSWNLTRKN